MTVLDTPPIDLAPRIVSRDINAFPVPHGREEEWRFTPMELVTAFMQASSDAGELLAEPAAYVTVRSADSCDDGWVPTDRPSAIARAAVHRCVVVSVPQEETVVDPIVVRLEGTRSLNYGHVVIEAGRFSKATVVLVHDLTVDAAGAIVTIVGDGADLTVVSVMDGEPEHVHLWNWHARLGRDSRFVGAQASFGGRLVRVHPSVDYTAPGGNAELLGAFLSQGGQHLEHRVFVEHVQPHCTSTVTYKGALSGAGARSVWIGDILVRSGAVGTTTYELNRNLLLDDGPRADSVPNLELETGDIVSAGHASATGRFDDEQLFYLQARGIPETLARQLVVRGFFADVLGRIGDDTWTAELMSRIERRLGMPQSVEDDE